ncbi:pesticidal protein Cry7Aa [Chryseobacterium sp. KBW03]|uniref:glycoside hydrolase family 130 protein n=1 Tax=Chryseobacterium sp. KBW03 TaxID=2153362 RepID=UPI000F59DF3F|nr:pesticidal protein Cry7Aa [Chryseobacterium sp. KBW03]RQO33766.1 pesticidal protein Cry7Aa [Chryseobacterium sp. KBW03]
MVALKKEGIILRKTELAFESEGVLNPAVIQENGKIHLFYRAVAKNNFSSIGYCILSDYKTIETRLSNPVIIPEFEYEKHGVEDPRIVKIDHLFYLTYTGYDGINALGALAISKDFTSWQKLGIIVPKIPYKKFKLLTESQGAIAGKYENANTFSPIQEKNKDLFIWDKNVIFFPRRIKGKLYFLHRIRPDIQIAGIENIEDLNPNFWKDYFLHFEDHILLSPQHEHEISYIGGGCPPIETEHGWLLIYHGVHNTIDGYVYNACAALLDLDNPEKEISRLPYPLFKPEQQWEKKGEVNNVCFPTGAIVEGDTLRIYYGAADERIAVVSLNITELLKELLQYRIQ